MHEIIDGERDRLNDEVSAIAQRYPEVHHIDRTGGGNVGDIVSFEVWFERGRFSQSVWQAVKADLRRVRLDRSVRRGRICYSK